MKGRKMRSRVLTIAGVTIMLGLILFFSNNLTSKASGGQDVTSKMNLKLEDFYLTKSTGDSVFYIASGNVNSEAANQGIQVGETLTASYSLSSEGKYVKDGNYFDIYLPNETYFEYSSPGNVVLEAYDGNDNIQLGNTSLITGGGGEEDIKDYLSGAVC